MIRYAVFASAVLAAASPALQAQGTGGTATPTAVDCARVNEAAVDHATMDHAAHLAAKKRCETVLPASPGQAAYGTISEVVRLLKADTSTDWSRVNVEALRQHLIDMDEVTMHATVTQRNIVGGAEMIVTGTGRTALAIGRMAMNHARMLDQGNEYRAVAEQIPSGARITITSRNVTDSRTVARIRGLGFAGLMTEGDHHPAHHMARARGDSAPHAW